MKHDCDMEPLSSQTLIECPYLGDKVWLEAVAELGQPLLDPGPLEVVAVHIVVHAIHLSKRRYTPVRHSSTALNSLVPMMPFIGAPLAPFSWSFTTPTPM